MSPVSYKETCENNPVKQLDAIFDTREFALTTEPNISADIPTNASRTSDLNVVLCVRIGCLFDLF